MDGDGDGEGMGLEMGMGIGTEMGIRVGVAFIYFIYKMVGMGVEMGVETEERELPDFHRYRLCILFKLIKYVF